MISMNIQNQGSNLVADYSSMAADIVVDNAGYPDAAHAALARYEQVDRYFPTADELRSRGIDVENLAACIEKGLIVCKHFGQTVANLSVDDLNGALEHLLENHAARKAHRSRHQRHLHLQGRCDCRVA